MDTQTPNPPAPLRASSLPRAVWVGGGLLSLAVAALAGALVMKSADNSNAASANAAPLTLAATTTPPSPAPERVGTPVPPLPAPQDEVAPPVPPAAKAPVPAAPVPAAVPVPAPAAAPAPCARCGTVESVQPVKVKGPGTGVGAVAGGVLGGVLGNQFGHGNGRAAMTVLGAVGGGFAGNEVEKHVRSETQFDVRVRMRDGSHRTFRQAHAPAVGTRVIVDGNRMRIALLEPAAPRLAQAPGPGLRAA